jgi:hypothetical protein
MFDKRRISKHGEAAQATVVSVDQRSHLTSNELRDYDHVLEVRPADRPAFRADVRDKFWIAGLRPQAGDVLKVRFDPKSLETVFDLEGDPRYDVDAMNARTAVMKQDTARLVARLGQPGPAPEPEPDRLDNLRKLGELRDAGVLTPEEFKDEKARILADEE